MSFPLARRMDTIKASDIREILKVTARPEVISLAGGLPAAETFPVEALLEATREALATHGPAALQYSPSEGVTALRAAVAERAARRHGVELTVDNVLITAGSQQGLDLTAKLFLDEGDLVFCESPTYLGALSAFQIFRPRYRQVPTDDDGMDLKALERMLAEQRPKLIYVIPDFQNPSGRCWSTERRRGLLDLAAAFEVPVIEDAPYADVRFAGEPRPSLLSMDDEGVVVHLGTFSKVFCPGMRLAWVIAPSELLRKYVLLKQGADLQTATLSQLQLLAWLERGELDANVARISELYRERREAMLAALEGHMPPGARWTRPEGGMFVWVTLPEGVDARDLLARCLERDVAFVPGESFFPENGGKNTMRLNYSAMPPERIAEGVARIAAALREMNVTRASATC